MRRYYVVVLSLVLSLVLLGLSYAKETSMDSTSNLNDVLSDDFRVIYSIKDNYNTKKDKTFYASVINLSNNSTSYVIDFKEVNDSSYDNLYYKVNDSNEEKFIGSIDLGTLDIYGSNRDHGTYKIEIFSKDDNEYNFSYQLRTNSEGSIW